MGPWWSVFEFDTDEGLNLMKGLLVNRGWALHAEIWSDQPPLLSLVLAAVFEVTGPSVAAGRAVVLFFAGALIWGLFSLLARREGLVAAWGGAVLLTSTLVFLRLGVSVMIGLPALALAVLALERLQAAGETEERRRVVAVVISGLLLAASFHTKLFTLAMAPAALLAAFVVLGRVRWVLAWSAVAAAAFGLGALLAGPGFAEQVVAPHLAARDAEAFRFQGGPYRLWKMVWAEPHVVVLAGLSLVVAPPWRDFWRWVPWLWLVVAVVALIEHRPLWYHQAPLVGVPLAWIAGSAVRRLRLGEGSPLFAVLVVGLLVWGGVGAADNVSRFAAHLGGPPRADDHDALELLEAHARPGALVATDRPIDAFRLGLAVPPPLAVHSLKRVQTGGLTPAEHAAHLGAWRPEVVSYRRLAPPPKVVALLDRDWVRVIDRSDLTLWLRRDLVRDEAVSDAIGAKSP